jgi:hypothetical protein
MSTLDNILAFPPGVRLLLKKLHVKGRLAPLIREALADQVVQAQAREAGLGVTTEELQKAADSFRRRHGLHTAAATQAWLTERGLSVDDFESGLEEDLLAAKVRQHVTADEVDRHWQASQAGYERLRLALVMVGREELAREVATQVRDDGRELPDVAREHNLAWYRGERFRKELGGPLAEALASADVGQLVGPVDTARDFTLAVIEERRPAELDKPTRQLIENELFEVWLAERLKHAALHLRGAETPG